MIGKGKVRFKNNALFQEYVEYYSNHMSEIRSHLQSMLKDLNYQGNIYKIIEKFLSYYMHIFFDKNGRKDDLIKPLSLANDYISLQDTWYRLLDEYQDISIISYGKYTFIIVDSQKYLNKEYDKDYSNISLSELKKLALMGKEESEALMIPNETSKLSDLEKTKATMNENINQVKKQIENIKNNGDPELQKMQSEIDKQMAVIKAMQQELEIKKSDMITEMNKIKAEMMDKVEKMKQMIQILTDKIYTIQCYMGDTFELFQIRKGNSASDEQPIIFLQKMRYLDEDLAQLFSIYSDDVDFGRPKIIEELLKYNDLAVNQFAPFEKCVTFFKISKDNTTYGVDDEIDLFKNYEMLHGNKVGFLIRNGENLYIGYTDEEKIILYDEVFLKPQFEKDSYEGNMSEGKYSETSYDEMTSRLFSFAILQGIIENNEIFKIPKPYNVFNPGSHIIFSYADNMIKERKFGDLSILIKNLNNKTKVGDSILVMRNISESSQYIGKHQRGRESSYANRTYDCKLDDGLNTINMIDEFNNYYVSVKKKCSQVGATSNFKVNDSEFLNLTYINSEWIRYYISSKEVNNIKIGGTDINYAYFVKYLKMAQDFVKRREMDEYEIISEFYQDLEQIRDWQVVLSHWKILNEVRTINKYQAKRFAKYLLDGDIKFLNNLFKTGYTYENKIRIEFKRRGIGAFDVILNNISISSNASGKEIDEAKIEDYKKAVDAKNVMLEEMRILGYNYTYDDFKKALKNYNVVKCNYYRNYVKENSFEQYLMFINKDFSFKAFLNEKEFINTIFSKNSWRYERLREEQKKFLEIKYYNEIVSVYETMVDILYEKEKEKYDKSYEVKALKSLLK